MLAHACIVGAGVNNWDCMPEQRIYSEKTCVPIHTRMKMYYLFLNYNYLTDDLRALAYKCIPEGLIYVYAYLNVYHRRGAWVVRRGMAERIRFGYGRRSS